MVLPTALSRVSLTTTTSRVLTEPAAECPTSPESSTKSLRPVAMGREENTHLGVGTLARHPAETQDLEVEPQRARPPD